MVDKIIKSIKRVRSRVNKKYGSSVYIHGYRDACNEILILIERIQNMSARKDNKKSHGEISIAFIDSAFAEYCKLDETDYDNSVGATSFVSYLKSKFR